MRYLFPGGETSVNSLKNKPEAILFINEAYRHCKAIAATGEAVDLLSSTFAGQKISAVMKIHLLHRVLLHTKNMNRKLLQRL